MFQPLSSCDLDAADALFRKIWTEDCTVSPFARKKLRRFLRRTFVVPSTFRFSADLKQAFYNSIIDIKSLIALNYKGVINWNSSCRHLLPLKTIDGKDSLFHAVSLALWGIHDIRGRLKAYVRDALNASQEESDDLYMYWTLHFQMTSHDQGIDVGEVELNRSWAGLIEFLADQHSNEKELPQPFHIFTLCHLLERPIIVYGSAALEGVYIPTILDCMCTERVPLVLCIVRDSFVPLVCTEDPDPCQDLLDDHSEVDCRTPISQFCPCWIPLTNCRGQALTIRCMVSRRKHSQLIVDYMDVSETLSPNEGFPCTCVWLRGSPLEPEVYQLIAAKLAIIKRQLSYETEVTSSLFEDTFGKMPRSALPLKPKGIELNTTLRDEATGSCDPPDRSMGSSYCTYAAAAHPSAFSVAKVRSLPASLHTSRRVVLQKAHLGSDGLLSSKANTLNESRPLRMLASQSHLHTVEAVSTQSRKPYTRVCSSNSLIELSRSDFSMEHIEDRLNFEHAQATSSSFSHLGLDSVLMPSQLRRNPLGGSLSKVNLFSKVEVSSTRHCRPAELDSPGSEVVSCPMDELVVYCSKCLSEGDPALEGFCLRCVQEVTHWVPEQKECSSDRSSVAESHATGSWK